MIAVMSVDVEEWFHIPSGTDNILTFDKWDQAPQRVQNVIPQILDLFDQNKVTATFFFLGWIAEKHPQLIKDTFIRGHEIAAHGYAHKLIYNQTQNEFKEDIYKAKSILENLTGKNVIGYRAPGFSITPETDWAFDILAELGFKYDSSIFPGKRFFGHYDSFDKKPVLVKTRNKEIIEFPQTLIDFGLIKLSFFGGGYFRLFPEFIIKRMCRIVVNNNRPLIMYIHPRDMDVDQPHVKFPLFKKLRHYINISKTTEKLSNITRGFDFKSFEMILADPDFIKRISTESEIWNLKSEIQNNTLIPYAQNPDNRGQ